MLAALLSDPHGGLGSSHPVMLPPLYLDLLLVPLPAVFQG